MLTLTEMIEEKNSLAYFERSLSGSAGSVVGQIPDRSGHVAPQASKELRRRLAEAILLQSIADLWDPSLKEESIGFFTDGRFAACAEAAGMSYPQQLKLLGIVAGAGAGRFMK
ncbi:MAG: hypothetical protein AB1553_15555 [Nitrospirota bacterium]